MTSNSSDHDVGKMGLLFCLRIDQLRCLVCEACRLTTNVIPPEAMNRSTISFLKIAGGAALAGPPAGPVRDSPFRATAPRCTWKDKSPAKGQLVAIRARGCANGLIPKICLKF